jgi:hypothetical protein
MAKYLQCLQKVCDFIRNHVMKLKETLIFHKRRVSIPLVHHQNFNSGMCLEGVPLNLRLQTL